MSTQIAKSTSRLKSNSETTPIDDLMRGMKSHFLKIFAFSGLINFLTLSTSIYMLQVYDRALSSQSKDTLYFLTLAVTMAILLSAILEAVRQILAGRIGTWMAASLGSSVLLRSLEQRLVSTSVKLESLRELNSIKNFISSPSLFNIIDMAWIPLYLIVVFFLHPIFGIFSMFGAAALFGLAWFNDRVTRPGYSNNQTLANANIQKADGLIRNAEVIDAMGMAHDAIDEWSKGYMRETTGISKTQETSSKILAISKFVRYMLQIGLLCIGALLVMDLQTTPGSMVASSILVSRLLAPVESAISQWRNFVLARHSYRRLQAFYKLPVLRVSDVTLPKPVGHISVTGLTYVPPGLPTPVLRNVNFSIAAGESVAIIGPSASGKTTLARLIVGILMPSAGSVRLDNAETFSWKRKDFGKYCGYLPQDIELFPGTIFGNIARFQAAPSEKVVEAAKMAGCHDLILHLPGAYDMSIGDGAHRLSGGQRQRIGLARALFGRPKLVVLDEPNSNLDSLGENALIETMQRLKAAGSTVVVVAHRTNLLRSVDKILVLQNGRVTNFGAADDVLRELNVIKEATDDAISPSAPSRAPRSISAVQAAE